MSNRDGDSGLCIGKRLWDVGGSFVPLTGAGTVVASTIRGAGFGYAPVNGVYTLKTAPGNNPTTLTTPGIVRTTTGTYTVTFEDPYLDVEYAWAQLAGPSTGFNVAGSAVSAQVVEPIANLGVAFKGPVMTIVITNNSGTVVEAPASLRCYFGVTFIDSTVWRQKP